MFRKEPNALSKLSVLSFQHHSFHDRYLLSIINLLGKYSNLFRLELRNNFLYEESVIKVLDALEASFKIKQNHFNILTFLENSTYFRVGFIGQLCFGL